MGRQEYAVLLKVTNRTIEMVVIWRKAFIDLGQHKKHQYLIEAANAFIAELTEFRLYLKGKLKGEEAIDLPEELRWLLDEIGRAKDPDIGKILTNKFLELTKRKLAQGQQEALNGS